MEKRKANYFSKQIFRNRHQIINKLAELEKDLDGLQNNQPKDWAEVNNDTLERETIMHKIDTEQENLRRNNAALRKLMDGSYGVCSCCSQRIPEARLRALPLAHLCIRCQSEQEAWVCQAS